MEGWVKFHRKIEEWEWYTDPNTFRLFFHLVLKANHKENKWRGIEIKRGELITSYEKLSAQLSLSVQQIRTSIKKLKSTNEITIKSTNKYTIITIENYTFYQTKEEETTSKVTSNSTNEQQTNNKQITTNKNDKNNNNDNNKKNKRFTPPTFEEVNNYCLERNNGIDAQNFIDHYSANGWIRGKTKIKDWKACVRTWERNKNVKPKQQVTNNKFNNFSQHQNKYSNEELERKLGIRK